MTEETTTMAAAPSIEPARSLHEHLAEASPDLLRSLLTTMIDTLMSAEADAVCGAAHGERSEHRSNHRNGYRHRDLDTRAGTMDVAIPKLRQGSYFPLPGCAATHPRAPTWPDARPKDCPRRTSCVA
jgi:putative transposase